MLKKIFLIIVIGMLFSSLNSYSEEEQWTIDKVLSNPEGARQSWHTIPIEKRKEFYEDFRILKQFSDSFASENKMKKLSLEDGLPAFKDGYLINGNSKIDVLSLKGAEVKSVESGGFIIKFPDNADLSKLDFDGGRNGISFDGNNLKFDNGRLLKGTVTIHDDHFTIGKDSKFVLENIEFSTKSQSFELYYDAATAQNNYIRIDKSNHMLHIVGNGIKVRFLEENSFERMSVKGKTTVLNGNIELEFDGNGGIYYKLPAGEPISNLNIKDENALEKVISLRVFEGNEGITSGYYCSGPQTIGTGNAILRITGGFTEPLCKNTVLIGSHVAQVKAFIFNLEISKNDLYVNDEQAKKVKEIFAQDKPDLYNDEHYTKLIRLIDKHVNDIGIRMEFYREIPASESQIESYVNDFIKKSNIELTNEEKNQVAKYIEVLKSIKKGDVLEVQRSAEKSIITLKEINGRIESSPVSNRLAKLVIRDQYNDLSAREYLKSFFPQNQRMVQK